MRQIKSILFFSGAMLLATVSASADRVIGPNVPRHSSLAANKVLLHSPVIERSGAREIARLQALAFTAPEQSQTVVEGVVQTLERPIRVQISAGAAMAPELVGSVAIEGGESTRIRFGDVPAGTVLWLAGSDDEDFLRFEPSSTSTWGPTTRGSVVYIAAEGGAGDFAIAELAHIAAITTTETSCLADVACRTSADFEELADASRAIGYVRFVRDGKSLVCTGGLLNDAANSGTPYFLTAHHCISTKEEAASVEVVWDLKSEACGSNRMAKVSRSHGAELLVASRATDVALLKLVSVPSDRVFLGVDTRSLTSEAIVHRISHARGLSQTYSSGMIDENAMTCSGAPRPQFIYTQTRIGATAGGSSGGPLLVHGLHVAGQLLGTCGPDPSNVCATYNRAVDGSLRASWPLLAPYLDPSPVTPRRRAVR